MSNIQKFTTQALETSLSEQKKFEELVLICGNGNAEKGKIMLMKELSFAVQAANKNYQLAAADPRSIADSVYNTVVSGLSLNPQLELADIVPYDVSTKTPEGKWVKSKQAQMQPRYGGMLKLCADTGAFKDAPFTACVYEGDEFAVTLGSNRGIHHVPKFATSDPAKITHVYTVFSLANGGSHIEVMPISRVLEIRNRSQSYLYAEKEQKYNSVWHVDFPQMAMKTCLKRGLKTVPKSSFNMEAYAKLGAAIAADNAEYGELPPATITLQAAQEKQMLDAIRKYPTPDMVARMEKSLTDKHVDKDQVAKLVSQANEIVELAQTNQDAPDERPVVGQDPVTLFGNEGGGQ